MSDIISTQQQRLIDGARNYAKADKSDPFALNRALAHIRVGIGGSDGALVGTDNSYNAEPRQVKRKLPEGVFFSDGKTNEFFVTEYTNVKRI